MCLKATGDRDNGVIQQHLFMFLCLRLLIIVPLLSKGIATPYSQFIGLKVTDSLQCKSPTFLIALSLTCAMFSFSLQCLSDVIPVKKNQKVYIIEYEWKLLCQIIMCFVVSTSHLLIDKINEEMPKNACWWLWPRAFKNSSLKSCLYMLYDIVALFFFHIDTLTVMCTECWKAIIIKATHALTSIYC